MSNGQHRYKDVLEKMIVWIDSGEYPVGSRLPPERELSERFGVSRPTIRQAITALEVLGRVTVKTGSGIYVLEKTSKQANSNPDISAFELTEARAVFEGEAAALAASMISNEELAELELTLKKMDDENHQGDLTSEVADKRFHQIISQATRNKAISGVIDDLWSIRDHSPKIKQAYQSVCKLNGHQRLNEHKEIFEALSKRDPHASRIAMHKHFARLLDKLLVVTEAEAVEEARRKALESRKRFSPERLVTNGRSSHR